MSDRRQNFDFYEMGIKAGEELVAVSDSTIKVKVINERQVTYNNKDYYLTALNDALGFTGNPCRFWLYKGKSLEDIFEETYPKEESELVSEDTNINEEKFRSWMRKSSYQDATINNYCDALKKSVKKLKQNENIKENIFNYFTIQEFTQAKGIITQATNFKIVNDKASHGAFNAGLIKYEEFLKSYSKENIMTTSTQECISLLKSNHNIILHGAPGTGKTYLAKEIAKAMGCTEDEMDFVQFHPSYDYTDFVEGLRPVHSDDGNSIGFERKDGVFKVFCEKAIKTTKDPEIVDNFDESWKKLVDKLDEVGILDIPLLSGRGTFPIELNEYGTGLASRTYQTEKRDEWISGKSKFFNKEQLYNVYRGFPGVPAEGFDNYRKAVVKQMKENFGLKVFSSAINTESQQIKANTQTKPFVFIIDEINRGEMSKIFGELFFSIDPSYRGIKGRVQTQYQNLVDDGEFVKGFYVPENVYIIGTMNDIDRSVESMDFAMRRRFIFKEITAEESAINMKLSEDATDRMTNLNKAISEIEGLNSSYHIGGAYFLKEVEIDGEMKRLSVESEDFDNLWELKLEPLLKEYLRGMEGADNKLRNLEKAYKGNDMIDSKETEK